MTCIVGYVTENKTIFIGGDSAGSDDLSTIKRKDPKVFIKYNKFIIGYTSSFRMGQLLMFGDLNIKDQIDESNFEYIVKRFIPALQKMYKKNGWKKEEDDGEAKGGTFLLGYNGDLFIIENDFQVGQNYIPYDSVGCGSDIAKGSMFALESECKNLHPEEKIIISLKAATEYSSWVSEPYIIKSLKYKENHDKQS